MDKFIILFIFLTTFCFKSNASGVSVNWGVSSNKTNVFFNSQGILNTQSKPGKLISSNIKNTHSQKIIKVGEGCIYQASKSLKEICFKGFKLYAFEVTNAEYREFKPNYKNNKLNTDNQPVMGIGAKNINDYINWINKKTNKIHRLPTSAEWTYAALSGKKFTDLSCDTANIQGCNSSALSVGSYKANNWGFYDMYGNAAEITADSIVEGDSWNGVDNNSVGFRLVVE
jgi:hypothetical protein